MAWTSMHFAVGMCGGSALTLGACLIRRRGWRLIPVGMTLGGLWAIVPDLPRLWREDFPSLPFASTLGDKNLELWLHSIGDLFFLHRALDAQPKEFALLGLAVIIGLYNLALLGYWLPGRRLRSRASRITHDPPPANRRAGCQDTQTTVADQDAADTSRPPDPVVARIGRDPSA